MEDFKDSYKGKLWSTAIQKAMEAPFPEVALQYLLNRVELKTRVDVLKEVLSRKWEAYNEREAISPMAIVSRVSGDGVPPMTDENVRQLQYVKVFDVEKLLESAEAAMSNASGSEATAQ
ncbi:MAG: hypothetical protein KBD16_00750 [Candidatus Pacebacteria bacterium]|nr:hypothetical protein [Candidatus Paceibacterota bacterium]